MTDSDPTLNNDCAMSRVWYIITWKLAQLWTTVYHFHLSDVQRSRFKASKCNYQIGNLIIDEPERKVPGLTFTFKLRSFCDKAQYFYDSILFSWIHQTNSSRSRLTKMHVCMYNEHSCYNNSFQRRTGESKGHHSYLFLELSGFIRWFWTLPPFSPMAVLWSWN